MGHVTLLYLIETHFATCTLAFNTGILRLEKHAIFGWPLQFPSCTQDDLQSTVFNRSNHVTEIDDSHAEAALNNDFENIFVYSFSNFGVENFSSCLSPQREDAVQTSYHSC